MLEAALWGLVAGSMLVIGALLALFIDVPRRLVAAVMAFGAGALISALAFDLTEEAFGTGGTGPVALGLAAGAVVYYAGDRLISRIGRRKGGGNDGDEAQPKTHGLAIVLGALLDGIPESIVLGASLIGGLGVSVSFLAAVAVSNLPEGLAGTRDLTDEGHGRGFVLGTWIIVALASGVAAAVGFLTFDTMRPETEAVVQAFAAGAILTMLADTMIPESHEQGGPVVSLVVVLGFAVAFFLSATS
ncbi:MAG TPA: ZIP family zinc transporter [Candidatus Limnocylindria bacterium]|jgi:ZIP family zinc transporter